MNYYPPNTSFLSEHSDNEPSINPESDIFTLSLGCNRTINFRGKYTGKEIEFVPEHNSLYNMTRASQNFFSHRIDEEPDCGERYSLTIRCVGNKFRRSTIIIGDSNTENYRFGPGFGSFGNSLPGESVTVYTLETINPADCLSYSNVVIQCGINNIVKRKINGPNDVKEEFTKLKLKVNEILKLKSNINVFICPLLPPNSEYLIRSINYFNKLICSEICDMNYKCSMLNIRCLGDESGVGLINPIFSRGDSIHVNRHGSSKLAKIIKNTIFDRYNLRKKESYSSITSRRGGYVKV